MRNTRDAASLPIRTTLAEQIERARQEGLAAAATERLGIVPAADGRWRSVLELAGNDAVAWPVLLMYFRGWSLPDRVVDQLRTDARYADICIGSRPRSG